MNKVILIGRLTRDPDIRRTAETTVARYTLAVDRRFKREGDQTADFISCVAFGKAAEFTEKYLKQGTKIAIAGRLQTGSYTNRDGQKVYTVDVIVEEQEFAESKAAAGQQAPPEQQAARSNQTAQNNRQSSRDDGFMEIPDGMDEGLPFN